MVCARRLAPGHTGGVVIAAGAGWPLAGALGAPGGAPFTMTPAKLRLAMAAMGQPETTVSALGQEVGSTRQTLYRHGGPQGTWRRDGHTLLGSRGVG